MSQLSQKKLEKIIRSLPSQTLILNSTKRVQVFTGKDAATALAKHIPTEQIKTTMEQLIHNNTIIKTLVKEKACTISLQRSFKIEDSFIIVKEPSNLFNLILSLAAIGLVLMLAMYQMWPKSVRGYTVYVAYLMIAFLVFMMVLGVIRLIVFCFTFWSHPPGIWLFPNLFADVGFVDSFIPVWSYHGVDTLPKKND
ncbi:Translocation protein S62 [Conglomerata obtusa]